MRLVTVATYTFPSQAQLARTLLEGAGIVCHIANEHTVNAYGLYSVAVGGVQLQVPEDVAEAALEILNDVEPPGEAEESDGSELVAIASFDNPLDAHVAASALDNVGIPHRIVGEGAFGAAGQVSILVAQPSVEDALRALGNH